MEERTRTSGERKSLRRAAILGPAGSCCSQSPDPRSGGHVETGKINWGKGHGGEATKGVTRQGTRSLFRFTLARWVYYINIAYHKVCRDYKVRHTRPLKCLDYHLCDRVNRMPYRARVFWKRAIFRRDQIGGLPHPLSQNSPDRPPPPHPPFLFFSSSSSFLRLCALLCGWDDNAGSCCFHVSLFEPIPDQRLLTTISGPLVFQFFLSSSSLHLYDAMESTLLEHPRSPAFMDAPFTYDSLSNLEPYLQYPQSPYGVSSMACMSLFYHIYIWLISLKCQVPRPHLLVLTSTPST